jgi:hypothetical protein
MIHPNAFALSYWILVLLGNSNSIILAVQSAQQQHREKPRCGLFAGSMPPSAATGGCEPCRKYAIAPAIPLDNSGIQ